MRYLLGLCSPAEREHIESDYFENDEAFQEMLTAEDDLIDAYACGELTGEERRRFEKSFVNSLGGRERVQFARTFADALCTTRPVETTLSDTLLGSFKTFQSPNLLRTAMIAAMIAFLAVLAWLVVDRRRMTNELRELRAESAELSKRTAALQRTTAVQRARHLPEIKNDREKIASNKPEQPENVNLPQSASPGSASEKRGITELPLDASKVANLLTLQSATTRDGYVAGGRADQTNVTLVGVDLEPLNTYLITREMSSSGGTTVRGTAKDPNGNVVSGATVTITDSARNLPRTQYTNENGAFVFNAIPPGTYSIEVKAPGFETASVSDLAALVDTPTVLDMQLAVSAVSERVYVTSPAQVAINTSDASLGNSFERKRITQLPLNANNVVGLLSLQAGVSRTDVVNGGQADQSSITLDGVGATIRIPRSLSWIRFQIALKTAAIHDDYEVTLKTADGRHVTSVNWIEPLTPNQTIIDTPVISTGDLPSGDYLLLLRGKATDGSFVKVAEYSFMLIKY